jgi:transposase
VKTDKVDARVLAELFAANYLPGVWLADDATQALRRQVARRAHIVRQRTRLKNRVQSILHRNLVPRCPAADLFGLKGRRWLAEQELPADERQAVEALVRQLDFHGEELRRVDAELARVALATGEVKRLITIPGVDATVALSIVAAVGDFGRFSSPQRLVSYLGLNPRVRQSGSHPATHGRITKQGTRPGAWDAGRGRLRRRTRPGTASRLQRTRSRPPRAADRDRRHRPQAGRALLAPDRKGRGLCLPAAVADREEAACARAARRMPSRRGRKGAAGAAGAYSLREVRRRESAFAEQGEHAYRPARRKLAEQGAGQSGGGCRHRGAALRPSSGNPARRGFHPHAPLFGPGSPAPAAILRPEPPLAT